MTKFLLLPLYYLLLATGAVWAATPAPQLPDTCPDLSKVDGFFNPLYWQINLQPLADAGQLQTNTNIVKLQGNFQSVIWSNYVMCNYVNSAQGNFSLQSKFVVAQPPQPSASTLVISNKGWRTAGYVILCTSTDPRDCVFQATMMIPAKPITSSSSDLQLQQPQDSLPHVPTN
jgi:hypothetical protein